MRIVVFGDSNIGGFAEDNGGMATALRKWTAEEFGAAPIEIVGVQGSSAGDWLGGIGMAGEMVGRTYARWKKLTPSQRSRADLVRLRDLRADLYIAAFGSNDAVKYGKNRNGAYIQNILYISDFLKAPLLWLDNGVNTQTEDKKRPMVNHACQILRTGGAPAARGVFLLHSSTRARQEPYLRAGGRAHPPWTVHYDFLRVAGPSAVRWVKMKQFNWPAIVATVGGVAGVGWMMTPQGRRTLRQLKSKWR